MKRLTLYFFRGLLTILPLGLTLYLLYVLLTVSEKIAKVMIAPIFGNYYFPGIGLILTILLIIILGLFISQPFILRIFGLLEIPFTNLPVVKSIYNSIKSFAEYFSNQNNAENNQAVIIKIPNSEIEMVGLLTRESLDDLPNEFEKDARVAVYLPMSYMVGGYTFFVPKSWIKPIPMGVEEVMRNSLIAWLSKSSKK